MIKHGFIDHVSFGFKTITFLSDYEYKNYSTIIYSALQNLLHLAGRHYGSNLVQLQGVFEHMTPNKSNFVFLYV